MWSIIAALIIAVVSGLWFLRRRPRESVAGRHVLITGGSEGIGFETAKFCVERGGKVTLIARTASKLEAARADILKVFPNAAVAVQPADVGNRAVLEQAVRSAEEAFGPVDICIASAGISTPKYFEDLTDEDFAQMLQVNYLGVVHLAKAALPGMTARGKGHFAAVSSMAAAVPFVGYAAYAPSKAATRALLDVLRNEFADTGVQFHIAFPPDTETAGFAKENETKPYETSHIWPECFNDVFTPKDVAARMMDDLLSGAYFLSSPDFFGNLLVTRAWGHFPRQSPLFEACIAPLFVGVHAAMVWMADRAVRLRAHHSGCKPAAPDK